MLCQSPDLSRGFFRAPAAFDFCAKENRLHVRSGRAEVRLARYAKDG